MRAALLAVAVVVASLNACTPKPNGPEPAAEKFFAALATGDTGAAAENVSPAPAEGCAMGVTPGRTTRSSPS